MRRVVKTILIFVALGVAAAPAALFVALDAQQVPVLGDPMGPGSGALVILALFYVIWLPGTVFALIWLFDRLGFHYAVERRRPRPTRKERRRQKAGLELLVARERAAEEGRAPAPGQMSHPVRAARDDTAARGRPVAAGNGPDEAPRPAGDGSRGGDATEPAEEGP